MQSIICPHCKNEVEITKALQDEVLDAERKKFEVSLQASIEEEREKIEKRLKQEQDVRVKDLENEKKQDRERIEKLMQDVLKANEQMRLLTQKDEERELESQKKLQADREKIKEEISKIESEKAKIPILEMTKQLEDTKKALEEAQRKSQQTSQQLQGEVLELELEEMLRLQYPHDEIVAIGKGVHGADIRHIVKSPRGSVCGVILWELKRTKHWEDKWLSKLKDDLRLEGAHIPVIVSQELPKEAKDGMGMKENVWIVSTSLILPLAELLRKNLYDVAKQKAVMTDRNDKTDLLYSYITGHEFAQQVEQILEVYKQMHDQITKEKAVQTRSWKMREEQVEKILLSTATIVGSMQGRIGQQALPIKGLELESGDEH